MNDVADFTTLHQPAGVGEGGVFDVVIANHGFNPGRTGGVPHFAGLIKGECQWLFTIDVLARLDCGNCHVEM